MLSKIEMKLSCEIELTYQMSSLFHGVLMELLPSEYVEYLHASSLHPYTQHLEKRADSWFWIVSCMNEKSTNIIINNVLAKTDQIQLKKKECKIIITQKNIEYLNKEELIKKFYKEDSSKYIQIKFGTPTAFKQNGRYVFYPDLHCIFQSLMLKYDAAIDENIMLDEETLGQLCENANIIRYDLKSVYFSLEGIKIPAFVGKITIKMKGTQTMTNFANLLFEFGTFSGVGIKTGLGMGNIKIIEEGRK